MAHRLESDVNRLVNSIISDYDKERDIDLVETFMPPNKDTLVKIIYQIRSIIFPGYFKNSNYRIYTVRNILSNFNSRKYESSIKNQELDYKTGHSEQTNKTEIGQSDEWYYII